MSYEDRINQLKDEFGKSSSKLRMADVEGSHTDACTKCTMKPIVKNHMCGECEAEHNQWLKDLVSGTTTVKDGIKIDADGYFTVYESKA